MDRLTECLLEKEGFVVECYSPFEIFHEETNSRAEGLCYKSWSKDYVIENIEGIHETIERWRNEYEFDVQPAELTESEMKELGFGKWTETSPDYLLPLWVYPFLPEEIVVSSITDDCGSRRTMKKSEIDDDHRMGFLAYGVRPVDYVEPTNHNSVMACSY